MVACSQSATRPVALSESSPAHTVASSDGAAANSDRLRFEAFDRGLPTRGQWRNGFAVADMNGDGYLDIVHGPARKGIRKPVIFLGNSAGDWERWEAMSFPDLRYDYSDAAAADFNMDGRMDIALAMHWRGLLVLIGDGKGNFVPWTDGIDLGPTAFSSRAIEVIDWDADGRPDIIAVGEGPRLERNSTATSSYGVAVYINRGNGTWTKRQLNEDGAGNFGDSLALGDLNADGRLDVVTASSRLGSRNILYFGQEDGSSHAAALEKVPPLAYVRAVTVGDLDHDGRADLALGYMNTKNGSWETAIDVFYARPGEDWERSPLFVEESRRGIYALDNDDVNGDGVQDLVALTGDGETWLFVGDGAGAFARQKVENGATTADGCRGYHVELVDIDDDDRDEIIAAFAGEPSIVDANECRSRGRLTVWRAVNRS